MSAAWEQIQGFKSLGEYERFVVYIEQQVADGFAREVAAHPLYGKGMIFGGRWFENANTKEVWRLIAPDFPFKGLWEHISPDTP
ncbi:MAG: hypothetical protein P4L10_05330 [Acidobacteriaceae bacterium]|nr:hypothetical protein [Acidobacteriaceae bacterium]